MVVRILLQVCSGLYASLIDRSRAGQESNILKVSSETFERYTPICQLGVTCADFSLVSERIVGGAALDATSHTTVCRSEDDWITGRD
jgi:hypothetical protein